MSAVYNPIPRGEAAQTLFRLPKSMHSYAMSVWEGIASVPDQEWGHISQRYARSHERADAWMQRFAKPFFNNPLPFDLSCSDDELRTAAETAAAEYRVRIEHYQEAVAQMDNCRPLRAVANPARRAEVDLFLMQEALRAAAAVGVRHGLDERELVAVYKNGVYGALLEYITAAGFDVDAMFRQPRKNMTEEERAEVQQVHLRQMSDVYFWRRWFRRLQERGTENIYRNIGFVHSKKHLFVSNDSLSRYRQRRARTRSLLQVVTLINELGQEFSLEALAETGNANPAIRRAELMVRIAGFEHIAVGLGHAGEFITITCPSRFHARHYKSGTENSKFDGSSPQAAAAYLSAVWARIRAALLRAGIHVYGFRVAEPHHDGTPHWHGLLFMPKDQVAPFRRIVALHACAEDRRELGLYYQNTKKEADAKRRAVWLKQIAFAKTNGQPRPRLKDVLMRASHRSAGEFWAAADAGAFRAVNSRVDFTAINWARGSAAGYIAKYIAKNIDGKNAVGQSVGGDLETDNLVDVRETSERVLCWASVYGIRQFQQIGGPPVTVWRELRRLDVSAGQYRDVITRAALAADAGDWGKFVEVMGGVEVKRKNRPVQLYKEDVDIPSRYGAARPPMVRGVIDQCTGEYRISRVHEWTLVLKKGGEADAWTCVNNCTKTELERDNARRSGISLRKPVFDVAGFQAAGSQAVRRDWKWWEITVKEATDNLKQGAKYADEVYSVHQIHREREHLAVWRNHQISGTEAARQVAAQNQRNIDDVPRRQFNAYLRRLDELAEKSAKMTGQHGRGIVPVDAPPDLSDMRRRKQTRLPLMKHKTVDERIADARAVHAEVVGWLADLAEKEF